MLKICANFEVVLQKTIFASRNESLEISLLHPKLRSRKRVRKSLNSIDYRVLKSP